MKLNPHEPNLITFVSIFFSIIGFSNISLECRIELNLTGALSCDINSFLRSGDLNQNRTILIDESECHLRTVLWKKNYYS